MIRKILKIVLVLVLVVTVAVAATLALGIPQRWLIAFAAGKALKSPIELGDVSTLNAISISSLKTVPEEGAKPKVELDGLKLDYKLWPKDGRHFPKLTLEYLTLRSFAEKEIAPAAADSPAEAVTAVAPRKSNRGKKGRSSNPDAFVPRDISIKNLGLAMERPGLGLDINGLSTDITLGDNGAKKVALSGNALSGTLAMGASAAPRSISGNVDIGVDIAGGKTSVSPLKVHVPEIAEIEGSAMVNTKGDEKEASIEFPVLSAQDIDLPGLLPKDFSLRFKRIQGNGNQLKLKANLDKRAVITRGTHLDLSAEDLAVSQGDVNWFEGDAALKLVGGEKEDLDLSGSLALNDNAPINLAMNGSPMHLKSSIGFEGWTRDQTLALIPPAFRQSAAEWSLFAGIPKLDVGLAFDFPDVKASAALTLALNTPGDAPKDAQVLFSVNGSAIKLMFGEKIPVDLAVTSGNQKLAVKTLAARRKDPHSDVTLENLDIAAWLAAVLNGATSATTSLNGSADLTVLLKEKRAEGNLDLASCKASLGPLALDGFSLKGTYNYAMGAGCGGNADVSAERFSVAGIGLQSFAGPLTWSSEGGHKVTLKSAGAVHLAADNAPNLEQPGMVTNVENPEFLKQLPETLDAVTLELQWEQGALIGKCTINQGANSGVIHLRLPVS